MDGDGYDVPVATSIFLAFTVLVSLPSSDFNSSVLASPANEAVAEMYSTLSLSTFLSHLMAFLNAHIACKDENSLAVFGALPGKRCVILTVLAG